MKPRHLMHPHEERTTGGLIQGRDPVEMGANQLRAIQVVKRTLPDAIRMKCQECKGISEVRGCADIYCALWPYRLGGDPWRTTPIPDQSAGLTDEHRI
jgi:hypothetical protein